MILGVESGRFWKVLGKYNLKAKITILNTDAYKDYTSKILIEKRFLKCVIQIRLIMVCLSADIYIHFT